MKRALLVMTCIAVWYGLVLLLVPTISDEGGVPVLPILVRGELMQHFLRVQRGEIQFGDLPQTIGLKGNQYHLITFPGRDPGETVVVAYPTRHTEYVHGLLYRVAFLNSAKRHYQSFLLCEDGMFYTTDSQLRFDRKNSPGVQDVRVEHNRHWGRALSVPDWFGRRGPTASQPPATSESGY